MLDITLHEIDFAWPGGFALRGVTVSFPASTHTAVVGASGAGTSTLLRLISGALRPSGGEIAIGSRRVNETKASRRPILAAGSSHRLPPRWSVQHALVAATRTRSLDRVDRRREYDLAVEKWELAPLVERTIGTLAQTEAVRLHLATIELLRPAVFVADRVLGGCNPSRQWELADRLFRTLRVLGTTVISVPSSLEELALSDAVVVLEAGGLAQRGTAATLFSHPAGIAAALAVGAGVLVPLTVRGTSVESAIGQWEVERPPFQGNGVAVVRPEDFTLARAGEDSDLIFGIEEAGFAGGRWIAQGFVSGAVVLRVALPAETAVHKGKLLALRYDPARFPLFPTPDLPRQASVPTDVVPPLSESR